MVIGLPASNFYGLFLVTEGMTGIIGGKGNAIPISLMMLASVGGYIWSVSNPGKGSLIIISGGLIITVYLLTIGGFEGLDMGLIFGLPFIVPGLMFYFTAD